MLVNYLKVAFRNIWRQRGYSFLTLLGLSVGLTCALLIALYVRFELSYDRFHQHADNLYRVVNFNAELSGVFGNSNWNNSTCGLLAPTLQSEFLEVANATRVRAITTIVGANSKAFADQSLYVVDGSFLEMFNFPLLQGDWSTALNQPHSICISEELARRCFGTENPLGKSIRVDNRHDLIVTAVLRDLPDNTHFAFDALASFDLIYERKQQTWVDGWNSQYFKTYVQLGEGHNLLALQSKLPGFIDTYIGNPDNFKYRLEPVTAIHLYGHNNFELTENSDIRYIYFYATIAFFILLIACFNYINLFTARSALRHREVGLRKVLGANQNQLKLQFLGEAVIFTGLAFMIALVLSRVLLPLFSQLIGQRLDLGLVGGPATLVLIAILVLLIAVLTGGYPALLLARQSPLTSIKGQVSTRHSGSVNFHNGLVIIQLLITMVLIVSTLVITKQLSYIHSKELGFNRSQVLTVTVRDEGIKNSYQNLINEINRIPAVTGVTVSHDLPTFMESAGQCNLTVDGKEGTLFTYLTSVDYNFLDFYAIELTRGRAFSPAVTSDRQQAYIVNETFLEKTGLKDPLNTPIGFGRADESGSIIGVISDFNFLPLQLEIEPLVLRLNDRRGALAEGIQYFSLRISSTAMPVSIHQLEDLFSAFSPGYPFEYAFLDERFDNMYRSEQKMQQLFFSFTALAILIAGLGLVGLAAFSTRQKYREIAIRKVLGATELNILAMLVGEFLRLVAIAALIALPAAFIVMERWLGNFSYRVTVGGDTLLLAVLSALIVSILTVGYQALQAARTAPAVTLKHE
ncbi:MAG: ABC transporter permease [Candidatus Neomarinimicrobiota bacterium]